MIGAAFGHPRAEDEARLTAWKVATLGAAALIFMVYSQFWVFPLLGEKGDPAASGIVRMLYLPAYAAALALFALSPRSTIKAVARQPFLILLLLIVAMSTLWSVAPDQTFRRVVGLWFTTLGAIMLAARHRWSTMAEIFAACFAALAVIAFLASLLVPSIGVMHELFPGAWRGVWPEKNALGGNMALGFIVLASAAVLNPRRAKLWWGFAGLTLLLVLLSTSKTSLVALLLGLGGLMFVGMARRNPAAGVATIWLAVLGVALGAALFLFASDLVFEVLGKDATFTGRTKIWDAAMIQIHQRPWTGYGYGVIWDVKGPWTPLAWIIEDAGFTPLHAHNAWIEQWLGLGVFGLAAFGLMYLQTLLLAALAIFRDRGAYLAVPFLLVYSLMSLTESVAVTYHDFRWVLFVAISVKLAWPDREIAG